MMPDQHAGLERLDRQRLALEHLVGHLEARTLETLDPALDRDPVAMGGGDVEFRPCIHHGNADEAILLDDVLLGKAGGLEQDRGRVVEHREIARIIHDVGGVAVAPLDLYIAAIDEHRITWLQSLNVSIEPKWSANVGGPLSHGERVGARGYGVHGRP